MPLLNRMREALLQGFRFTLVETRSRCPVSVVQNLMTSPCLSLPYTDKCMHHHDPSQIHILY